VGASGFGKAASDRERIDVRDDAICGGRVRQAINIFVAVIREIFDESAYARFLDRKGVEGSRESYVEFLRESDALKARRPRCC
jgi:hypothetical protein